MRANEIRPNKLVIFDIDDTLVHTQTKVHVIKDGRTIKSLNSHEFTHYKLQPGESFDFGDFRNAEEFFTNAKPIIPMINQLKHDIATGNKVVMVTARADFNDRELFLDTFRKYGIDMSKVHVYRAGNMTGKIQTEEKKKIIIRNLLNQGNYSKAIMYDDAVPNLHSFMELKKEYPHTKFYAWHVSLEGEATEYQRTNEMKASEFISDDWRKKGVAENYHSDLMKQTYAKFFKPAPPKTAVAVKKFLSGVIISLGTAQDNDYDEEEPEEISWEQDLADVREAYSKLRGNSSPNWFDIADAVLSYDTEFRESMLEWAEEELGNELVDFLWHEVWEAKHKISRSDGSYNVTLGHQNLPGQKNDRDSFKEWDPETDPPNPFANLRWLVMINGEQKIKFGGVGNSQEAAMKTATNWANNHGYEREVQAGKVKVVRDQQ